MARRPSPPKARLPWPPTGKVEITLKFIERAREEQRPGAAAVDVRDTRGPGLMLRVSPRTISWGWKAERFGRTVRLDLGPVERLTIAQARQVATDATELLRSGNGWPSPTWLSWHLVDVGIVDRREAFPDTVLAPAAPPPKPRTWTYDQAVDAYLAAHEGEWKASTLPDARKNLRHPILLGLLRKPVSTVTPDVLATLLAAKNKTHHRQAEAIFVRLRHFFDWLASPGPRLDSGVAKGVLDELQRPKKPKPKEAKDGTLIEPVRRQRVRFPTMERVGLLVALARTDLLEPPFPAVLLLLVATVQRRYAIATAKIAEFAPIPTEPGWGVWRLPPVRRKTGEQDSAQAHHSVPLPPPVWAAVREQIEASSGGAWLFPGMRPRRKGETIGHLSASTVTHLMASMPVDASPHDLRRALRSHGARTLRLPDGVLDLIIDHAEGVAPGSVSERHYVDDDRLDLKLPVIRAWWSLVEEHAAAAAFDLEKVRADFLAARARQKGREPGVSAPRKPKRKAA